MGKGRVRADEVLCPQAASPSLLPPPSQAGGWARPHPCGQPRGAQLSVLLRVMDSEPGVMDSLRSPRSVVAGLAK